MATQPRFPPSLAVALAIGVLVGCSPLARNATYDESAPGLRPGPNSITEKTEEVEIVVRLPKSPARDVALPIRISRQLEVDPDQRIWGEFPGIPISLPVTVTARDCWTVNLSSNLLQLMAQDYGKKTYRGRLIVEPGEQSPHVQRKEFPLKLTFEKRQPRARRAGTRRSAG